MSQVTGDASRKLGLNFGEGGCTFPVVESVAPDTLVAVRTVQPPASQHALRRLGSWCGQLHATEVTAGMTVTVVEGAQGGPKQVEHLSSDEAVKVFVEAGRPVTLTFRLP